ncbi:MAG: carbohydrate kinase [Dokdonella sp.]
MNRIVCFGEALIDFLGTPQGDAQQPRAFLQHAGGAPANVAVGIARLGAHAEFVGMLGMDMFGDFLFDSLRGAGVHVGHVQRTSDAPTALAFVSLDTHGERSFSFYRPPAADLLFREAALGDEAFTGTRIFHACSNSLTESRIADATFACMQRARSADALVSFDMNLRPALWPARKDPGPRIWAALARADVIKLSSEEFAFLSAQLGGYSAVLDTLWIGAARFVVVTDGARLLRWFTPERQGALQPFHVRAVDTTAAGDAFTAGMLHELARRGIDAASLPEFARDASAIGETLRFAAACGALAVTRHGAFAAMPTRDEVHALLGHHDANRVC